VLGPAAARRRLEHLVAQAQSALDVFGGSADTLKAAARFVAKRRA
jgi:farnesyl diphosphate synthase